MCLHVRYGAQALHMCCIWLHFKRNSLDSLLCLRHSNDLLMQNNCPEHEAKEQDMKSEACWLLTPVAGILLLSAVSKFAAGGAG